jgi:hypothetical protein
MAVDSSYVYWAGLDANIHRVPITGGAPIDVLATNQLQVLGLAVTTQALYWIEPDTIWTVALPDGPATEFFQLVQTANPTACSGLAANDDAVAWACGTGIYVQLTGGPRNIVAEGVAPHSIALDAVRLYWSDPGANTIMSVPLAGGMPAQLATSNSPDAIAVDDTNVYWTGQDGVQSVPKQGGSVTQLACALTDPAFLAVDGSNVYWTDLKAGTASKVAKTGGTPVVIASGQAEPFAIAVDATSVYWTATGSQANKFTDGAVVTASK